MIQRLKSVARQLIGRSNGTQANQVKLDYDYKITPRYGHGLPPHALIYERINRHRDEYEKLIRQFEQFAQKISRYANEGTDLLPSLLNSYLPPLDAIGLYSLLALKAPAQYIEIGSGNSTKFAKRSILDNSLPTRITSLDPFPRAEIDQLCDQVIRQPLEEIDPEYFDTLQAGDFLFYDGSHRSFTNSDVTVFFLEILPRLKPGVIVHIHDIHLPYDYPKRWNGRYYNEQYLLACHFIADDPRLRIILPNSFIQNDAKLSASYEPLWLVPEMQPIRRHLPDMNGSCWMTIV